MCQSSYVAMGSATPEQKVKHSKIVQELGDGKTNAWATRYTTNEDKKAHTEIVLSTGHPYEKVEAMKNAEGWQKELLSRSIASSKNALANAWAFSCSNTTEQKARHRAIVLEKGGGYENEILLALVTDPKQKDEHSEIIAEEGHGLHNAYAIKHATDEWKKAHRQVILKSRDARYNYYNYLVMEIAEGSTTGKIKKEHTKKASMFVKKNPLEILCSEPNYSQLDQYRAMEMTEGAYKF